MSRPSRARHHQPEHERREIDRFDGVSLESDIWDAIEARRGGVRRIKRA